MRYARCNLSTTLAPHDIEILNAIIKDNSEELSFIISKENLKNEYILFKSNTARSDELFVNLYIENAIAFFGALTCYDLLISLQWELKTHPINMIHYASAGGFLEMVRKLETSPSVFLEKDINRMTPSHFAARFGNLEIIQHMFSRDINMFEVDACGYTPAHYAAKFGHIEVLRFLLEVCSGNRLDTFIQQQILSFALANGHLNCVVFLHQERGVAFWSRWLDDVSSITSTPECFDYVIKRSIFDENIKPGTKMTDELGMPLVVYTLNGMAAAALGTFHMKALEILLKLPGAPNISFNSFLTDLTPTIRLFLDKMAVRFPHEVFEYSMIALIFCNRDDSAFYENQCNILLDRVEMKALNHIVSDIIQMTKHTQNENILIAFNDLTDIFKSMLDFGVCVTNSDFETLLEKGILLDSFKDYISDFKRPQMFQAAKKNFRSLVFIIMNLPMTENCFYRNGLLDALINISAPFHEKEVALRKVIKEFKPNLEKLQTRITKLHLIYALAIQNPKPPLQLRMLFRSTIERYPEAEFTLERLLGRDCCRAEVFNNADLCPADFLNDFMEKFTIDQRVDLFLGTQREDVNYQLTPDIIFRGEPLNKVLRDRNRHCATKEFSKIMYETAEIEIQTYAYSIRNDSSTQAFIENGQVFK